jgi:hypothetical protein
MLLLNTTLLSEKFIFAEVTMNVVIIPADEDDDAESSSRYKIFQIGFNDLSLRCAAEMDENPNPPPPPLLCKRHTPAKVLTSLMLC